MTNSSQPRLNGAFYGPSIPPPSKTYHLQVHSVRRGGGGRCCCCGCLGCLCSCIVNLIFQILCTLALTAGAILFVMWLIFRPNNLKFYADDVSLTRFDLSETNNTTLYYNLSLNLTVRNPNKRIGIYYDSFETSGYYENQRFATESLTKFYQGHKNTTSLAAEMKGQNLLVLQFGRTEYDSERKAGVFNIDLKLRLRVRLEAWWFKSPQFTLKVNCDLKVPINATFEGKRCAIDW